jgi:hypothetical protein
MGFKHFTELTTFGLNYGRCGKCGKKIMGLVLFLELNIDQMGLNAKRLGIRLGA